MDQQQRAVWTTRARYFAAAMAVVTAVFYFLIAAKVLPVVDIIDRPIVIFGLISGAGYLAAAGLLVTVRRRWLWIAGAVLQIFVILMYFQIGSSRTPHFEVWGLVMRAPQALILAALVYLSMIRPSSPQRRGEPRS